MHPLRMSSPSFPRSSPADTSWWSWLPETSRATTAYASHLQVPCQSSGLFLETSGFILSKLASHPLSCLTLQEPLWIFKISQQLPFLYLPPTALTPSTPPSLPITVPCPPCPSVIANTGTCHACLVVPIGTQFHQQDTLAMSPLSRVV